MARATVVQRPSEPAAVSREEEVQVNDGSSCAAGSKRAPGPTAAQLAAAEAAALTLLRDYAPRSTLRVPVHEVSRARYPVIDVHKHLGLWADQWPSGEPAQLVEGMDRLNLQTLVNLDGFSGDLLKRNLERYAVYPSRFFIFAGAQWHRSAEPGFGEREARELAQSVRAGAKGFKVFKTLGLHLHDDTGALLMPDDPRLDPLWAAAGELGIPILIHVADPPAFFRPVDRYNENLTSLVRRPEWQFAGPEFPSYEELMERQLHLFRRHPQTTFIGAHVLNSPHDLAWVRQVLWECPNVYVEISARIQVLARQPRVARRFCIEHQDRMLFGTDGRDLRSYPMYYRVLETADDYIGARGREPLHAGMAPLYGLDLPDGVLRKLYHDNAARLFSLPPT